MKVVSVTLVIVLAFVIYKQRDEILRVKIDAKSQIESSEIEIGKMKSRQDSLTIANDSLTELSDQFAVKVRILQGRKLKNHEETNDKIQELSNASDSVKLEYFNSWTTEQ